MHSDNAQILRRAKGASQAFIGLGQNDDQTLTRHQSLGQAPGGRGVKPLTKPLLGSCGGDNFDMAKVQRGRHVQQVGKGERLAGKSPLKKRDIGGHVASGHVGQMQRPPSTSRTAPVIIEAASEQRNVAAEAMS